LATYRRPLLYANASTTRSTEKKRIEATAPRELTVQMVAHWAFQETDE
jgi:hypothetical protein